MRQPVVATGAYSTNMLARCCLVVRSDKQELQPFVNCVTKTIPRRSLVRHTGPGMFHDAPRKLVRHVT